MELKKFRNKYGLELIPASTSNIILGTLVWDPLIGRPEFEHPGMPNHIFNAFIDAGLISESEWRKYLRDAKKEKEVDAGLAGISLNVDINLAPSLEHPQLGKINNSFALNDIKKFTFGDLKAKTMSNLLRVRINEFLEIMKRNHWEKYDGKIRRVFMITELYYGSMKLVIDNKLNNEFDAAISNSNLTVKNKLKLGKSVEYTFDHQNVPFAMRIEKVRDFNG